jgi:hypothetical protein
MGEKKKQILRGVALINHQTIKQRFYSKVLHPNSKLTNSDVIKIKSLLKEGETGTSIARLFNVSHPVIYAIKNKQIWTHVGGNNYE